MGTAQFPLMIVEEKYLDFHIAAHDFAIALFVFETWKTFVLKKNKILKSENHKTVPSNSVLFVLPSFRNTLKPAP